MPTIKKLYHNKIYTEHKKKIDAIATKAIDTLYKYLDNTKDNMFNLSTIENIELSEQLLKHYFNQK